jgi:hypothetical protein
MNNVYTAIAKDVIENGINSFNCSNFNIEYRKNKNVSDLTKLVDMINIKCKCQEDKITVLAISIKNIFKEIKIRKVTIIKNIGNGNFKVEYDKTTKSVESIKDADKSIISVLAGYCRVEK